MISPAFPFKCIYIQLDTKSGMFLRLQIETSHAELLPARDSPAYGLLSLADFFPVFIKLKGNNESSRKLPNADWMVSFVQKKGMNRTKMYVFY